MRCQGGPGSAESRTICCPRTEGLPSVLPTLPQKVRGWGQGVGRCLTQGGERRLTQHPGLRGPGPLLPSLPSSRMDAVTAFAPEVFQGRLWKGSAGGLLRSTDAAVYQACSAVSLMHRVGSFKKHLIMMHRSISLPDPEHCS